MKNYLLKRIREPSTWAGIGVLLTLAGATPNPETLGLIQQVVTGAVGLLAITTKEGA